MTLPLTDFFLFLNTNILFDINVKVHLSFFKDQGNHLKKYISKITHKKTETVIFV